MRVKSIMLLSDSELCLIQNIMKESSCPNESLRAVFPEAFHRFDKEKGIIYFGAHSYDYTYELEV